MKKIEATQRQILLNSPITTDGSLTSIPPEFSGFNLLNGELLFNQPSSDSTVNVYMSPAIASNPSYQQTSSLGYSLLGITASLYSGRNYTLSVSTPSDTNAGIKFSNNFFDKITVTSPNSYNASRLCTGDRIEWSFTVKEEDITGPWMVLVLGTQDSADPSKEIQLSDMLLTGAEPINEIRPISFGVIPGNGIKLVDGKITSKLTWS